MIRSGSEEFAFHGVEMRLSGVRFHNALEAPGNVWTMHIPFSDEDYLVLAREFGVPGPIVPLAEIISQTMTPKLPALGFQAGGKTMAATAGQ